jgi:hypothetical protein
MGQQAKSKARSWIAAEAAAQTSMNDQLINGECDRAQDGSFGFP